MSAYSFPYMIIACPLSIRSRHRRDNQHRAWKFDFKRDSDCAEYAAQRAAQLRRRNEDGEGRERYDDKAARSKGVASPR